MLLLNINHISSMQIAYTPTKINIIRPKFPGRCSSFRAVVVAVLAVVLVALEHWVALVLRTAASLLWC
jgi:hypothetical protein